MSDAPALSRSRLAAFLETSNSSSKGSSKNGEIDAIRDAVRQVVMDFMVDLRESEAHTEEAVFFNDWAARGTLVKRS